MTPLEDIAKAAERWLEEPTRLNADRLENLIVEYRREPIRADLTPRQQCALNFIRQYRDRNGTSPIYREIGAAIGLRSMSGIHRLMVGLEARGRIRRIPASTRAIEVIEL
jgi:hypothetical protein